MKQGSFHTEAYDRKKKVTRFDVFLSEMDQITPWAELSSLVERHYPKAGRGRHPYPLMTMLRVYCVQQWYNLSDPAMEDWLYSVTPVQRFVGLVLGEDEIPDETTILNFRRLLEKHHLQEKMFTLVRKRLESRGLLLKNATIVDATIVSAPMSTKNRDGQRDPEMRHTRKGNRLYFGMKVHAGADKRGLVHHITVTDASVHDSREMEGLLHGQEKAIYGDKAYADRAKAMEAKQRGIRWRVARKGARNHPASAADHAFNRRHAGVRAFVEHPFLVVKHLWGHGKVRYRGLEKNRAQMFMLFGLANLYRVRRSLLASA